MSSVNSYCTIILEYLVVTFSLVTLVRGVGGKLSRLVYLAPPPPPPPAQDLSQALSSVSSYCTITLEYLVVRVVNIISVKLRCLHLTFSSVILVRGVGAKLSRLVYLALRPGFESVNSYCTITLEYLIVRVVNIISVKLRCSVRLSLSEGWEASCPGWFIEILGGGEDKPPWTA